MSFGIADLKDAPQNFGEKTITNEYGIQSPMVAGLGATRKHLGFSHPLESSELNYHKNNAKMEMLLLRNTQGLHAPMRLAMELKSSEKVGRLPFLPSSNVMRDVILGCDTDIGFEDILNIPEFREQMGQPHAVVEKSLGIL